MSDNPDHEQAERIARRFSEGRGAWSWSDANALGDAYLALAARAEAAEKQADCDCVPVAISSKACPKCGRRAVISQEHFLRIVKKAERSNVLEARLAEAEESIKTIIKEGGVVVSRLRNRLAEAERENETLRGFLLVEGYTADYLNEAVAAPDPDEPASREERA